MIGKRKKINWGFKSFDIILKEKVVKMYINY